MVLPSRLPSAPMPSATAMQTRPMRTETTPWSAITRPRCGTRVNVVSPLRWLHSLVTDRIATIGSSTAIGMPTAAPNEL